jgi:hypothetical protein
MASLNNSFKKNPGRIFILDGCGAIVSGTCLGIIIPMFQDSFGMPLQILHILALIALVFAIYSFTCYFLSGKNWKLFLRIIMTANALYCLLTAGLVIYYFPVLTLLGLTYFVLEIIVICLVIWFEGLTYSVDAAQ